MLSRNSIKLILSDYVGGIYVNTIADKVCGVFLNESKHTHKDQTFFCHTGSNGELVYTEKSAIFDELLKLLRNFLAEDVCSDCASRIYACFLQSNSTSYDTIKIEPANICKPLLKLISKVSVKTNNQKMFLKRLKLSLKQNLNPYEVPTMSPSIPRESNRLLNKKLQYMDTQIPATGYSYHDLEDLGSSNGMQLGTLDQYIVFLGYIWLKLTESERVKADYALSCICDDSSQLGCYKNSRENPSSNGEFTGTRFVCGFYDLATTSKILKQDEHGFYYIVSGDLTVNSSQKPLAYIESETNTQYNHPDSVGWFVFN